MHGSLSLSAKHATMPHYMKKFDAAAPLGIAKAQFDIVAALGKIAR